MWLLSISGVCIWIPGYICHCFNTEVVETPAVPDREEEIMDAAVQINEAVTKITEEDGEAEPAAAEEIAAEEKPKYDDEGEYTIRPKFDFDNLRFGTNFTEE